MRDFRDAKAMAQTLREALKSKSVQLSQAESLELTARMLGFRNWNVLAATIKDEQTKPAAAPNRVSPPVGLPVIPMRDIVFFPQMTAPLFVGRPRTARAVERAMAGDRRVLLVAQRRPGDDDPGAADLHRVGVLAEILQVMSLPDGSMKVMVHGLQRAAIAKLVDGELLQAEHELIATPRAEGGAVELAQEALRLFEQVANLKPASPPQALVALAAKSADPAALADLIAQHVSINAGQVQALLETADPAARLQRLIALMSVDRDAA